MNRQPCIAPYLPPSPTLNQIRLQTASGQASRHISPQMIGKYCFTPCKSGLNVVSVSPRQRAVLCMSDKNQSTRLFCNARRTCCCFGRCGRAWQMGVDRTCKSRLGTSAWKLFLLASHRNLSTITSVKLFAHQCKANHGSILANFHSARA